MSGVHKQIMKEHHDIDNKEPVPSAMAAKLFMLTALGVVAYALAVYLYIEVFAQ